MVVRVGSWKSGSSTDVAAAAECTTIRHSRSQRGAAARSSSHPIPDSARPQTEIGRGTHHDGTAAAAAAHCSSRTPRHWDALADSVIGSAISALTTTLTAQLLHTVIAMPLCGKSSPPTRSQHAHTDRRTSGTAHININVPLQPFHCCCPSTHRRRCVTPPFLPVSASPATSVHNLVLLHPVFSLATLPLPLITLSPRSLIDPSAFLSLLARR